MRFFLTRALQRGRSRAPVGRRADVTDLADVSGELADAARRGASGQAWAELQPSELVQLALAVAADDAGLGDGVVLGPVRAQPLDRLGAVANEAAALQLEHPECPDELGLLGGPEIRSLRATT